MEKIKIRGLVQGGGVLLGLWGVVVALKGAYDLAWGEPEANFFSPRPWEFITRERWLNWAGFEVIYGAACVGLALLAWRYAAFVPAVIERHEVQHEDF